jgi:hypothetical protein
MRERRSLAWLGVDAACVLVFCGLGRRSHDEALTLTGLVSTAWPFLTGTVVGWAASRGWRAPTAVVPTGVTVWLCTMVVGMLLRIAGSAGVAVSFIAVAASVTAALLLGWRALATAAVRRPRQRR